MSKKVLKIGNAGGYWGDDPHALERQVNGGRLDYISMDFLAEITMSIMQKQRSKDSQLGYARDFIPMLEKVLKKILEDKTTIITNAGGVNPQSCADAIAAMAAKQGLNPKIAIVYGDDIMPDLKTMSANQINFDNMETGEKYETVDGKIQSANIYYGAAPVVEALKWNPDIVITGRVTDTGITVAPMIHEFGWSLNDWDKIASGIISGHMMECGTQVTGGNFTDWDIVDSYHEVGFPISEVEADGSFTITKHEGSGGLVSLDTVREQVFYEMGDPKAYLTPDVVADFSTIRLESAGKNRVRVSGIKGYEPTPLYKVSMAYTDGYKAVGSILISGPYARKKAEAFADIFWRRAGSDFSNRETEYFGWNACQKSLGQQEDGNEILLRLGATSNDKNALRVFGKLIPSLILSGPPGVAVTGGVPRIQEVVSYWPALIPKTASTPKVALYDGGVVEEKVVDTTENGNFKGIDDPSLQIAESTTATVEALIAQQQSPEARPLVDICLGRSGDKGDTCNVGIMARGDKAFAFLDQYLSAQRVKNLFQELCFGKVTRHKLDGLTGFNFLLESALGGGGTKTMRSDAQGKTFAQALLRQKVVIPKDVLEEAAAYNQKRV